LAATLGIIAGRARSTGLPWWWRPLGGLRNSFGHACHCPLHHKIGRFEPSHFRCMDDSNVCELHFRWNMLHISACQARDLTVDPHCDACIFQSRRKKSQPCLCVNSFTTHCIAGWILHQSLALESDQSGNMIDKYFAAVFFFVPFPGLNSASGQQLCI